MTNSNLFKSRLIVDVPGFDSFDIAAFFVRWATNRWGVKNAFISHSFQRVRAKRVETNVPPARLQLCVLGQKLEDNMLIQAYGGPDHYLRYLAYLAYLVAQQPNGEAGPLLTNNLANIAHIPAGPDDSVDWAIEARYDVDSWRYIATPVMEREGRWDSDYLVISLTDSGPLAA